MHRFFVKNINASSAILSEEDSLHAFRVLRLGVGDRVTICDTVGFDYDGVITTASKDLVEVQLENKRPSDTEPEIKIALVQALPKTGKMEVIIQKCVELGVCDFYPVITERCVVRVDRKSKDGKIDRYNKIAHEAAKQSMRGIIPCVHDFCELKDMDLSSYDLVIIPYEEEKNTTVKALIEQKGNTLCSGAKVAIIIGPEGGFESSEVNAVVEKGGVSITLGKRILRTETAGMATVAMLMAFLEG